MHILYGSGNILVTAQMGGGASSQIIGFVEALQKAGHIVDMDVSGTRKLYPQIRTRGWLAWVRNKIPLSWLVYETLQSLNNRKIHNRLTLEKLSSYNLLWQRYELHTTAYAIAAHSANLAHVFFIDAPLIIERQAYAKLWLKSHAIKTFRQNLHMADLVVVVSRVTENYVREYIQDSQKIQVMPNGFSEHILETTPESIQTIRKNIFGDFIGKIIGFIGSPMLWHRLDYLVLAAYRLSQHRQDFRVLIVGEGPDSPKQRSLVKELMLQSIVKFTGSIPFSAIAPYLGALDIGVMPSSNLYGSPMKIVEYMACGAVVVAPDLEPISDLCTNETDGLLFPKDDVDALCSRLDQLLDSDTLYSRLRINARKRALANYSWEARINKLDPFLRIAIRKHTKKPL
jgi:glycosyltransferase involved in cell wall biosynthesis